MRWWIPVYTVDMVLYNFGGCFWAQAKFTLLSVNLPTSALPITTNHSNYVGKGRYRGGVRICHKLLQESHARGDGVVRAAHFMAMLCRVVLMG